MWYFAIGSVFKSHLSENFCSSLVVTSIFVLLSVMRSERWYMV